MSVSRMRAALGTFVEIAVEPQDPSDIHAAHRAINAAYDAIEQAEQQASFHRADSDLSRVNLSPDQWVSVSRRFYRLLQLAKRLAILSDNRFNPTVGGQLVSRGKLPDHGFDRFKLQGSISALHLQHRQRGEYQVKLSQPVLLVLDGIAKGFAVDSAVETLRRHGIPSGSVNAGGDMRVFGDISRNIVLRGAQGMVEVGTLNNAAMATSATTDPSFPARLFDAQGTEPSPGSWSILSNRAWRADALTKVAALAGEAERQTLVQKLGGYWLAVA